MEKNLIKRRLIEQKETLKKLLKESLIERTKLTDYNKYVDTELIKAVIGPRRAGKTTLGLLLLRNKDFHYVNFDDELLINIKKEELGELLELLTEDHGKKETIFLDEIQNIAGWELFANRLNRNKINLVLSGSNSKLLSKELSTHLGGRVFSLEILPFSFKEFLETKKFELIETDENVGLVKNYLNQYIASGGFPETFKLKMPDLIKNYHKELFDTIVFKDIAQRFRIRQPSTLMSLANIILNQFSCRTSLTKIAKELNVSTNTLSKYVDYLEEGYLILCSKKFSFKPKEIELSFKKYYAIDTGLLNSKKTTVTLDQGKLMENIVAIELRRRGNDLFYYMVDNKYEVDFVIIKNGKVTEIIQVVKDDLEIPKRELDTGLMACKELKINNLKIISWNREESKKINNVKINIKPLWKFLLE